jgi:hypothetical protein
MNWFRSLMRKAFRGMLESLVSESLDKALAEVHADIESSFSDPDKQAALKSGTFLLKQRLHLVIRERLES